MVTDLTELTAFWGIGEMGACFLDPAEVVLLVYLVSKQPIQPAKPAAEG
jgi:hypothetical protein